MRVLNSIACVHRGTVILGFEQVRSAIILELTLLFHLLRQED